MALRIVGTLSSFGALVAIFFSQWELAAAGFAISSACWASLDAQDHPNDPE